MTAKRAIEALERAALDVRAFGIGETGPLAQALWEVGSDCLEAIDKRREIMAAAIASRPAGSDLHKD